jgi:hypothetical protein
MIHFEKYNITFYFNKMTLILGIKKDLMYINQKLDFEGNWHVFSLGPFFICKKNLNESV